jgi:hypothetical protein
MIFEINVKNFVSVVQKMKFILHSKSLFESPL